jgi:DNA replication protein DnaC
MQSIGEILSRGNNGTLQEDVVRPCKTGTGPAAAAQSQGESICPICRGTGYYRRDVPAGHPDFGRAFDCECQEASISARRLESMRRVSHMESMGGYTFDTFNPDGVGLTEDRRRNLNRAFIAAQEYAADPQGWLVFSGVYGCGKTHLAAAIANERIRQGKQALFVVVPDLLDHLRAAYAPQSGVSYDERFDAIRNAPLLILDDLGTQNATEWSQEKLFQIFNYRYPFRLPTVVTTNQELDAIHPRVRSRLVDPDLVHLIPITALDFRSGSIATGQDEISSLDLHGDQTFESFSLRQRELGKEEAASLEQALTFCRSYADTPEDWLVLTGTYGCGKTHLAAAVANAQAAHGRTALFVVVPDLLDHLRATYAPDSRVSYDKRLDMVRKAPLLVLDDLGTQSATPWAQEKLFQIFDYRYNAQLPTVITMTEDAKVAERLKSRLLDRGRSTVLHVGAPSYRGGGGRQRKKRP